MQKVLISRVPNLLSFIRIVCAPLFFMSAMLNSASMPLYIFLTIAILTDFLDGFLARKFKVSTTFGAFLDPLADKIFTLTAFTACALIKAVPWWFVFLVMLREVVITLLRFVLLSNNTPLPTSFWGKGKTVLQMIFLYFIVFRHFSGFISWEFIISFAVVILIVTWLSAFKYLNEYYKSKAHF